MRRGMSKKAKAEAYDKVDDERGRMWLVLHDIATGAPHAEPVTVSEPLSDSERAMAGERDPGVVVEATGTLYRALGAEGGLVLLRTRAVYSDGSDGHTSDVRVVRLDDMRALAGGDNYFQTEYGRAVYALAVKLGEVRRVIYAAQEYPCAK